MNQASFFIEKKALFGGYPNHNQLLELMDEGVVWFVDLTNSNERNIKVYSHLVNNWINYPIKDGHIPENKKNFLIFLLMIQMVLESLKPGEKLYLHCKGGHGRSSLVISCFLSMVYNIPPLESLDITKEYHALRPNLKSKWLVGWPLSLKQRKFVENFFGSTHLYTGYKENLMVQSTMTSDARLSVTKSEWLRLLISLNFYMHQHETILDILLNSGLKKIMGEDTISVMLQELRFFMLYSQAKKLFDFG